MSDAESKYIELKSHLKTLVVKGKQKAADVALEMQRKRQRLMIGPDEMEKSRLEELFAKMGALIHQTGAFTLEKTNSDDGGVFYNLTVNVLLPRGSVFVAEQNENDNEGDNDQLFGGAP